MVVHCVWPCTWETAVAQSVFEDRREHRVGNDLKVPRHIPGQKHWFATSTVLLGFVQYLFAPAGAGTASAIPGAGWQR